MDSYRVYGTSPFKVILLHGGPGGAGELESVAIRLSEKAGIIEALQTENSITGQLNELHDCIENAGNVPVNLIGHSWGAWLAWIYAATYPKNIEKLFLVSAASFHGKYNLKMFSKRKNRLSEDEQKELVYLNNLLNTNDFMDDVQTFKRIGELFTKADSYDLLPESENKIDFRPDIYHSVWNEAETIRGTGELLNYGTKIKCPVVLIHGKNDPHSYLGVQEPISKVLKNFRIFKLENCGHYPWRERHARERFFEILEKEIE
jgi:pimeloyl-ACP methyl ester carboxylesterase